MALSVLWLAVLMSVFLSCVNCSGYQSTDNLIARVRREVGPSLRGNGNGLIDESIVYWKEWLKENGYDPLHINSYSQKLEPFVFNVRDCTIVGLTTLKRTGDVSLNASEGFIVAVANVGIEEVSLDCLVDLRWSVVRARGSISGKLKDYSVEGEIVQIRPPPRITELRITNAGSLDLKFNGEGVMGTIVEWLAEGYLKYKLKSLLTNSEKIREIANDVLLSIDVNNIFIDHMQLGAFPTSGIGNQSCVVLFFHSNAVSHEEIWKCITPAGITSRGKVIKQKDGTVCPTE